MVPPILVRFEGHDALPTLRGAALLTCKDLPANRPLRATRSLVIPTDLIDPALDRALIPEFFELQVKTLFQHAWSEANHDLGYKPGAVPLTADAQRRLAFTAAQAWGADHIFDELFGERTI